jgi:hypothetical protein
VERGSTRRARSAHPDCVSLGHRSTESSGRRRGTIFFCLAMHGAVSFIILEISEAEEIDDVKLAPRCRCVEN